MRQVDALVARARHGKFAGEAAWPAILATVRDTSPFLSSLLDADPDRAARITASDPDALSAAIVARQSALGCAFAAGAVTREAVMRDLRRNRAEHALVVALADLAGAWDLEAVVGTLTAFADASTRSAVAVALADAVEAGGLDPSVVAGEGSGLVVLAYGKMGAGELNYSSDIDLVVFFDPGAPALRPAAEPARLYNRVAQGIVRLLSERTPDGYVHRVDYRLRPDPGSMPAAVSLPSAYTYYESVGQNWERAAMIKARPVAGDLALGARFLADLRPFVWRKYFDFASIADIHAMKRQIHAVRGFGEIAVAGHDIKLGRGGIREVEFFVQTQQLVFGGRRPALRGTRTLDMLRELAAEGWITAEARDELAAAYRFLRLVEHRLQMVADEQTQRLPTKPDALERLARLAGFHGLPEFAATLEVEARRVQHHYGLLFEDAPTLSSRLGDLVFTGTGDDPGTLATLARLGFRDPAAAVETVRGWHFGRRAAITSARAREVITELTPPLLEAIGGTGDPDGALARLDAAFSRMPAAVELLIILRQHERLRVLFADLLGSAPRLADEVAAKPHILDAVIDPSFAAGTRDAAGVERELRAAIGDPPDLEGFLDGLRDGAHQLQFVHGARLLSGLATPEEAGPGYAAIASAAIRVALDRASGSFSAEHGMVPGAEVAVLGLGRLGAGDLTAASDLDLVVLYDFDPERRTSEGGPRPLDAIAYHTRLAQRLIAALTAPTRRGRLYAVDMRLRPSGSQGPVASQLSGFRAYHSGEAELWEHMALTRARVIAGPPDLARRIEAEIAAILCRPRDVVEVYSAVRRMRGLVRRQKGDGGPLDLKLATGGLMDLDFLAQALVLAHASRHPAILGRSTGGCLAEAGRLGLVPRQDARELVAAHRVLDAVHHWRRLTIGEERDGHAEAAVMARIARHVGVPDGATLAAFLADVQRPVGALFERLLSGERGAHCPATS